MTGFGTVETAIDAMKRGAYDYILKPFKVEEVIHVVQRGLEKQRLAAENLRLREALSLYKVSEAIAASLSLDEVLATVGDTALHEIEGRPRLDVARRRRGRLLRAPAHRAARPRSAPRALPATLGASSIRALRRALRAATRRCSSRGQRAPLLRTPPDAPLVSLVAVPLQDEDAPPRLHLRRELHQEQALRRGAAEAPVDRRLARGGRDRERAPLRGPPRHLPADDPGPRQGHRQDGPLHAGHSDRVAVYAMYLAVRLRLPPTWSRSCARARSCTTSARSAA
jgi:CheY-like chemotaxis protein